MRGLANATLHHHSESSEHSRNLLGRHTTCTMLRLKTLLCSTVTVREYRLNYVNNENILCNRGLAWQSQQKIMHWTIVLGVPTQVREYGECYQNSQPFAVTGISSTCYGRIQNSRLRTLGVPVSNSDSREALRNSHMPRSSKFELRFFFTVMFPYTNYKTYIGSSNAISWILRTFSKFP